MPPIQDCQQCGRCCEKWGWGQKGITEDIVPWIAQGRTDILKHVGIRLSDGTKKNGRDISRRDLPHIAHIEYWVSEKGRKIRHCPFFFRAEDGKAYCRIHDTKPKVCTSFTPWNDKVKDYALNCPARQETTP